MKNYYEILEVAKNASPEVIERAYKVLAKKYHPDKWPKNQAYWAEDKFKEINEAYYILSDETLRYEYDLKINSDKSYEDKYNNLFAENEKLKQEVNNIKIKNITDEYSKNNEELNNNKKATKKLYIKNYSSTIKSIIHNEINKPQEERSRDLKALILTIIIVSILVVIFLKVPFLHKLIFP